MKTFSQLPKNNSGFMTAEFLFAFTMVIGSGILIFALTFALTTVEISQYIVWSAARAHAAGAITAGDSRSAGETKYTNMTAAFPLLTGNGSDSPWFKMPTISEADNFAIGDISELIKRKDSAVDKTNSASPNGEARHPWIGVQSSIDLVLLKSVNVPFLGKITESPDDFNFPVRAVLFRHPSYIECYEFTKAKFSKGVQQMLPENSGLQNKRWNTFSDSDYEPMEDNGC